LPPPAPGDCFGRDELVEKVVGLAENLEPIALIGAGGIGKTSIALTVLHHNRIIERFGGNRGFIRCDQFPASRAHLLARLSTVISAGVENPEDLTPLRPLLSSKEMLIILDNAESILDPQVPNAQEIYSVVEELSQFKTISLLITSRISTVPQHCKRPEIPTLSMEAACDIFYGIYGDSQPSITVNDLLRRLDFHALSIILLANTASQNTWDYNRLAKEWDAERAQVLQTDHSESLAATIELSLASPTLCKSGTDARDLLGVIAFFPQGIDENNLDWLFPTISNRKNLFDKFCVLSLTYRSNGFVTMLAPIRDYLCPQDPRSSPLLCTTRDRYFSRLSVFIQPQMPGFAETRWVVWEDVNVEHLLDVFTSFDQNTGDAWSACYHFVQHLHCHKPRRTVLGSKIEALPDDHDYKAGCLFQLSHSFQQMGNYTEQKRLLTRSLELERRRGDDLHAAQVLRFLSNANLSLGLRGEGIQQAKAALEVFERVNDVIGQALCLNDLAWLLFNDKQLDAAEDAASRAISLFPTTCQDIFVGRLIRILGSIYQSKKETEKAIRHFERALEIAFAFGLHDDLFWTHCSLAELFLDEKEFNEAHLRIYRAKLHSLGDPYKLGCAMFIQATVLFEQGRLEDAKWEASQALDIFEKLGAERNAENCWGFLQMVSQTERPDH
jgi:tetratricopeptide (TPR) repeat protein